MKKGAGSAMDVQLKDILVMKKTHPCGECRWEVLRTGMDFRLRCLGCGASVVDPNKCLGCGQCTTKCVFDAIHLHREHPECSRMNPVEDMVKKVIPYELKRQVKIKLNSLSGKK